MDTPAPTASDRPSILEHQVWLDAHRSCISAFWRQFRIHLAFAACCNLAAAFYLFAAFCIYIVHAGRNAKLGAAHDVYVCLSAGVTWKSLQVGINPAGRGYTSLTNCWAGTGHDQKFLRYRHTCFALLKIQRCYRCQIGSVVAHQKFFRNTKRLLRKYLSAHKLFIMWYINLPWVCL